MREREGGGEGKEGAGQVVQGLVGQEDLGFYPKGGGSPGGLQTRDLTQVFTGALLWPPWGRQTEVGEGGSWGPREANLEALHDVASFQKETFYFGIILNLQTSRRYNLGSPHMLLTRFPPT